jgi:hypothetical protein
MSETQKNHPKALSPVYKKGERTTEEVLDDYITALAPVNALLAEVAEKMKKMYPDLSESKYIISKMNDGKWKIGTYHNITQI